MTRELPREDGPEPLGWWAISGEDLLEAMRRAHAGEDPDMIFAEYWANSLHERVEDEGTD